MATDDGRAVQGGPALPVVIVNQSLPGSTPSGTQDVRVASALPAGTNNIGDVDVLSIADGANVALGAKADTPATTDTGSFTLIALFKRYLERFTTFLTRIPAALDTSGNLKAGLYVTGNVAGDSPVIAESGSIRNIRMGIWQSTNQAAVNAAADGILASVPSLATQARQMAYNGTTWDLERNNFELTLLASAARTTTTASADQINYNGRSLLVLVNVSNAGTGSILLSLHTKDPISGSYFTFWTAAAALTANGTYAYYFADGATGGNFTEIRALGLAARTFRVNVTHNNANSITYSVAGVILV